MPLKDSIDLENTLEFYSSPSVKADLVMHI